MPDYLEPRVIRGAGYLRSEEQTDVSIMESAAQARVEHRDAAIPNRVRDVEKAIENLGERIEVLSSRLYPVLRPQSPIAVAGAIIRNDSETVSDEGQLATTLTVLAEQLAQQARAVQEIFDRLEV